ncbi:MAG: ATP-binding protein [Nitrospirae bacterium]|nr:ATP-binding protein [Nitrospirota bacterium]
MNLYPRKILREIKKYLYEPGIIVLVGARQVGKTSILHLVIEELNKQKANKKHVHYFDLEDFTILEILNKGIKEFIGLLKASGADIEKQNYIFIDEIQYMQNPANFLKLLNDKHKNLKLIVSGSSTLEIRRKFKDSLAGRKVVFEVYPLDFYEFLIFKNEKKLADAVLKSNIRHFKPGDKIEELPAKYFASELAGYFREYVVFGGYPKIALEAEQEKKVAYLMDIYNSYIKKDIKDIMRIDNITAFNNLIKALSLQTGGMINISELCTTVKIARDTLERYLFLLENTFVIKTITPFSNNPRKEISKMKKIYFVDTGLRNIVVKNFHDLESRTDSGGLLENTVCGNIMKNLPPLSELHFWRTLSKNEVDFVLVEDNKPKAIEVKNFSFKSPRVPTGIRHFEKDYQTDISFVLNKDFWGEYNNVYFSPVWLC